jgi:hypothetical protein
MDIRESFSGMKKSIKHLLTRSKRKTDRTRADERRERTDPSGPNLVMTGGGREREGSGHKADKSVQPSPAADKNKSDWKYTASASTKLLLRGVRDSADAFPPLKSVAGGLFFILENCEVCLPVPYAIHGAYRCSSERGQISKQ